MNLKLGLIYSKLYHLQLTTNNRSWQIVLYMRQDQVSPTSMQCSGWNIDGALTCFKFQTPIFYLRSGNSPQRWTIKSNDSKLFYCWQLLFQIWRWPASASTSVSVFKIVWGIACVGGQNMCRARWRITFLIYSNNSNLFAALTFFSLFDCFPISIINQRRSHFVWDFVR